MIGRWGPATCPTPPEGRVPEAGEVGCASGRPEMGVPADPDRLLPDPAARETYVPRARSLPAALATYPSPIPSPGNVSAPAANPPSGVLRGPFQGCH